MIKKAIKGLQCYQCNWMVPADPFQYTCTKCGKNLDFIYDYELIATQWSKADLASEPEPSMWRYHPLLPVGERPANTSLRVGGTPLLDLPNLAERFGTGRFMIKDDTRNPSGSLKDRASELGIQHAREQGQDVLVAASTGNAGSSLAALTAYHGLKSILFVPAAAPPAKLTQIRQHGARLVAVDGNYDQAFDLAYRWAQKNGHYCRNTGINPVLAEGKKTAALEIAEACNWKPPHHVFVPVGDGCIISGMYKGFFDLMALGWIDEMPRLHAVQAEGSAAIVKSLSRGGEIQAVEAQTLADSISVDLPRDGEKARRAILESGGIGIQVSDDEILLAQQALSQQAGLFTEPAAAASFAGFLKAREEDLIPDGEDVLILATGSGLKDIPSAQKNLSALEPVAADLETVTHYLSGLKD